MRYLKRVGFAYFVVVAQLALIGHQLMIVRPEEEEEEVMGKALLQSAESRFLQRLASAVASVAHSYYFASVEN